MVPILFESTETLFTSNGKGRLVDCISCVVVEERNGIYECEFTYPINGKLYDDLVQGGIIGVIHDDNHDIQPFDIYKVSTPINGIVTFNACHISYRLNDIVVAPFNGIGIAAALAGISTNSVNTNPFSFSTDITNNKEYILGFMRSARGVLLGEEGSILEAYHGEYKFDKFNVSLLQHRGSDTGVTIRYGKNITDITREKDTSGTYNAIAPYWTDGTQTVTLPEVYVQPTTPITPVKVFVLDMTSYFSAMPTVAELRSAAVSYLDSNTPWIGTDGIELDFVALWQTPEYADIAEIQRVGLCDTVSVYWTDAGIVSEKIKVVRTEYNVLAERFDKIHLGSISNQYVVTSGGQENAAQEYASRATKFSIYNTVKDVGYVPGDAGTTIAAVYASMPTDSILICYADQFATGETPTTVGLVEMVKGMPQGGYIHLYGKRLTDTDYRMYLDNNNSPDLAIGWRPITQKNITSGSADLNSYTTPGLYYFQYGVTLSNVPNNATSGWLEVLYSPSSKWVKQIWHRLGGISARTFVDEYLRVWDTSNWSAWVRFETGSYLPGDSYSSNSNLQLCGIVTASTKELDFTIALPKSLTNITGVSVTSMTGSLRGISGYLNSDSSNINLVSTYTVSAVLTGVNYVRIRAVSTTAFTNTINNTPAYFWGNLTMIFS